MNRSHTIYLLKYEVIITEVLVTEISVNSIITVPYGILFKAIYQIKTFISNGKT